jgi:putative heme iron utilization protein
VSALTHAERSRTLARGGTATLSTLTDGYPYGSLIQYAVTDQGEPLLLISELAEHTQNLHLDSRASLLVWDPQSALDPLASGRVTLLGKMVRAPVDLLEVYLATHPQARQYAAFKDFHLWRLEVDRVRYIAGFGEMSWVSAADYHQAQPDPVAEWAAGVIQHMNEDHGDALLLLASQKLDRPVSQAEMVSCDGAGYQLRVDGHQTLRLEFAQRCRNSQQLRQEFIRLVQLARG